jgi:hypothetical protein
MSTIMLRDLSHSQDLDRRTLSAIRGGFAKDGFAITVNPQININQSTSIAQNLNLNILNGADLRGLESFNLDLPISPTAVAANVVTLPGMESFKA